MTPAFCSKGTGQQALEWETVTARGWSKPPLAYQGTECLKQIQHLQTEVKKGMKIQTEEMTLLFLSNAMPVNVSSPLPQHLKEQSAFGNQNQSVHYLFGSQGRDTDCSTLAVMMVRQWCICLSTLLNTSAISRTDYRGLRHLWPISTNHSGKK